jgi:hypothetical protein
LASLPLLHTLELNVESCDVGDECRRGLALLRRSASLRRVSLRLGAPTARLLSALGAVRYVVELRFLDLCLDMRYQPLTDELLDCLGLLVDLARVCVTLRNAVDPVDTERRVRDALRLVPFLSCIVSA